MKHLGIFAQWGSFAACGAVIGGYGALTQDHREVTCPDCSNRLVVEQRA